jgi:hypothetical protein
MSDAGWPTVSQAAMHNCGDRPWSSLKPAETGMPRDLGVLSQKCGI